MTAVRSAALGLFFTTVAAGLWAADPPGEPGYVWAEEVRYKEVVRYACREVADVKKVTKVVYTTKDAPFCLRTGAVRSDHQPGCGSCAACKGPYSRKVLVKTEITTEEPTTKCVVERIVETVPYKVMCKVPVGAAQGPRPPEQGGGKH